MMIKLPPKPDHCELCEREMAQLTRHHLIPKRLHRKKRFKKRYSRECMIVKTLWVCRPCHNAIHKSASELELGLYYNEKEKLLQLPQIAAFVDWISTKDPGFYPS